MSNAETIAQLRLELARVISSIASGRVADRGRVSIRAKELDARIRQFEGEESAQ